MPLSRDQSSLRAGPSNQGISRNGRPVNEERRLLQELVQAYRIAFGIHCERGKNAVREVVVRCQRLRHAPLAVRIDDHAVREGAANVDPDLEHVTFPPDMECFMIQNKLIDDRSLSLFP